MDGGATEVRTTVQKRICRGSGSFILGCAESEILGDAQASWIQGRGAQGTGTGVRIA